MTMSPRDSHYAGRQASLATLHGKGPLVAPAMAEVLGLAVTEVAVDTDAFGTFSGETPRRDTPLVTAEKKARAGMSAAGTSFGFATEGSIGTDGFLPIVTHVEVVVFVDDVEGFSVAESATSHDIIARHWELSEGFPSDDDLRRADFPHHALIVVSDVDAGPIFKGLRERDDLDAAVSACWALGATRVIVQSDLRAHQCPSRRPTIERAARRLAERLAARCTACDCAGWGAIDIVRGRPCASCARPTQARIATVNGCCRCDHREMVDIVGDPIDPAQCDHCNP